MRILVLGAGLMGGAIVYDLARSKGVKEVSVGDLDLSRAEEVARRFGNAMTRPISIDVREADQVVEAMDRADVVISAVTLHYNDALAKVAIKAGISFCDLGGSDEIVMRQKALHEDAKGAGVTIVPNCGLAPGMANVVVMYGVAQFDEVSAVHVRVGGIPQHPKPPLNYQLVFTVDGLITEYTGKAKLLRKGKIEYADPLTGIEPIEFAEPFGTLEAFHTSGGSSFLPEHFQGKVDTLDYKTIRYPGHAEKFKALLDIGFASSELISLGSHLATPRELFCELLKKKLPFEGPDAVLMRIIIKGRKNDKDRELTFNMVDRFDETSALTAMMRTTAFPTSVIAQMIGDGRIDKRGVWTPEECVPPEPFLADLRERGFLIEENWN